MNFLEIGNIFQIQRGNYARQPVFFLPFPLTAHDFELWPVHEGTHITGSSNPTLAFTPKEGAKGHVLLPLATLLLLLLT